MLRESNVSDAQVVKFYRDHPFPDFDINKYETAEDLEDRASWYFKLLDAYIPENSSVIEIGCGTGQLVNFLALKPNRQITGLDLSDVSLDKARQLRDKLQLKNLSLTRGSLFDLDPDKIGTFDYTFCNGVLHHTDRPYEGFQSILRVVKPSGFVVVGYYNGIARIPLRIARAGLRKDHEYSLEEKRHYLEKLFTVTEFDSFQIDSWFADQFEHPREHVVSVPEALNWFEKNEISYLSSFPPIEMGKKLIHAGRPRLQRNPFLRNNQGTWKYQWLALRFRELSWMLHPRNEGGYFTVIGQRGKQFGDE
jgi:SAM-dependent methyltransferase